jgi:hypothetical protein
MAANNSYPAKSVIGSPVHATMSFLQPVGNAADGKILIGVPVVSPTDPAPRVASMINKYYPNLPIDFASLWGCAVAQVTTTALTELGPIRHARVAQPAGQLAWQDRVATLPAHHVWRANRLGISSMYYLGVRDQKLVPVGEYPLLSGGR